MASDSEGHTHLLPGDVHGVPENCPDHRGVAGRCGQGPVVAVVLSGPLGKQLFNAETRNVHFLVCRDMLGDGSASLPTAEEQLSIWLSVEIGTSPFRGRLTQGPGHRQHLPSAFVFLQVTRESLHPSPTEGELASHLRTPHLCTLHLEGD